jgi:ABC-type nitrate/sulfonate/bicarbonate transport system substrate-binding protein
MTQSIITAFAIALAVGFGAGRVESAAAPEKLVGIHSARVMSQSLPWMAHEAGLFKKHNLDFSLVFISSSGIVTAALLGGDAEMTVTGGIGNVAAYARGSTDVVFIGGIKNTMTQTLVAGGNIKKPEDLRGKKIGVSRIGGNSHYFSVQALRRFGSSSRPAAIPKLSRPSSAARSTSPISLHRPTPWRSPRVTIM